MKIIEQQFNAIGDIPPNTKYVVLVKQAHNYYSAVFFEEFNECNLCGVRGNIVLYVGGLDNKVKEEMIYPLLAAGNAWDNGLNKDTTILE